MIARDVATVERSGPDFTVCTLVTDDAQYRRMLDSFAARGFAPESTEFLFVDNRAGNRFDAYSGLNLMLARARGRYVICCHQDVELVDDGRDRLLALLADLERRDPAWAVVGNAGGDDRGGLAISITDPHGPRQRQGDLPFPVWTLDENFLVVRRDALVGFSTDLSGFHLYGTDLCLQARLRGRTAYVVDFHLQHHSPGRVDAAYLDCLERLEAKYEAAFRPRRLRTTVKPIYLKPSHLLRPLAAFRRHRRRARALR